MVFDRPNQLLPQRLNDRLAAQLACGVKMPVGRFKIHRLRYRSPAQVGELAPLPQRLSLRPSRGRLERQLGVMSAVLVSLRPSPVYIHLGKDCGTDVVAQRDGKAALGVLEQRLARAAWLAGDGPTIADIACFPYAALAPQGGFDLAAWPAVAAWVARVRALPRYVPLPGEQAAGP
jgi:glutathione S-transferase